MLTAALDPLHGTPHGALYDPAMPKTKPMGVEALRKVLGPAIQDAAKDGTHLIVRKRGEALGVFVPMDWYRHAREVTGEPTDL